MASCALAYVDDLVLDAAQSAGTTRQLQSSARQLNGVNERVPLKLARYGHLVFERRTVVEVQFAARFMDSGLPHACHFLAFTDMLCCHSTSNTLKPLYNFVIAEQKCDHYKCQLQRKDSRRFGL